MRFAAPVPLSLTHQRRLSARLNALAPPSPPVDALTRLRLSEPDTGASTTPTASTEQLDITEPVVERAASTSPRPFEPARLLPAEALEEFLSILRPNMFLAPSSPIARYTRTQHRHSNSTQLAITATSPPPLYERPGHPYKLPRSLSRSASSASRASDDAESPSFSKRNNPSRSGSLHASVQDDRDIWHSVILHSPVSRSIALNPVPRDPVYENISQNLAFRLSSRTPSPALLLSPSVEGADVHMKPVC
ncbi:hypothetical protein BKA62DRAFT_765174 [Auriculariales sp. MPI-PUGE-AT-0066]|nr:hypothetical protein BKA62DRAFT_765174 [Auriculariales sp. MPI-PUGE-AT-0066]